MKESGPVGLEAGPDSGPGAGRRHCQPQQQQREQREQPVRGGGSDSATPTNNNSKGPVDAGTAVVNGNGPTTATAAPPGVGNSNNFEYEDSEWDIGIGNLIIDLDADIEKNNGHQQSQHTANSSSSSNHATGSHPDKASSGMPSGGSPSSQASGSPCSGATVPTANSTANAVAKGKMAATAAMQTVTHSTEPAGLKMKIKRTKPGPGTRSTEAKHEIVKSDGSSSPAPASSSASSVSTNSSNSVQAANGPRHSSNSSSSGNPSNNSSSANSNNSSNSSAASAKGRNVAAAHKRDKSREKHVASPPVVNNAGVKIPSPAAVTSTSSSASVTCSVAMTTSSGVTVTPVVSSASSVVSSSASVRLANSGALTVTPVAALPSSGAGGRTPPSGTECRPLSVLPQTIATNGSSPSNSSANYSNSAAPVTVTPVSGTQISPVMVAGLANANGNTATTSPPNHNSTCPRPEEPPSPPNKKWRGHLPTENKVPMDTSPQVPNSVCPSTGRGVMMMAVPSSGSTSGSGMANGTHSSSSPNSLSVTASQPASRSDACVGTCSASTMTEPECLGPCEPGTAVTLEGIVWHETEGGVLVVNVTWRGKTYVGTLLDCTRHDWAPPRFCDSPTSDVESRVPKGRAKRGRGATGTPVPTGAGANSLGADPSLSPMHSKLRNGAKGRRGVLPAPPSPAKETGNKRKGGRTAEETNFSSNNSNISSTNSSTQPSSNKRSRSSSRGAGCSSPTSQMEAQSGQTLVSSPMLIECPEPNCSKKYRHINGLKYHQSHAHSSGGGNGSGSNSGDNNFDEDSNPEMPVKKEADESEVAPFTGKVPMPPGPNASVLPAAGLSSTVTADGDLASPQKVVASSTSIPRTPTPSPSAAASKMSNPESVISATPSAATASASSSSNVNGQANVPVNAPPAAASAAVGSEHVFTPIQPQPPATGPWVTSLATPGSRLPPGQPASETADSPASGDSGDHRKLGKHKKKSKDRDRDRDRDREKERKKSEINPPGLNGSQSYPPAGSAATPSSPLVATGEVGPAAPLLSNGSVTNPPAVEQSREEVQSPAYSDISDANDQPPILNDADLSDGLNKKHDKLASVEGLPGNPVAPPGAGHLGSFGMYPFYGQPPYMVPPGAGPTNLSAKELEQRREEGLPPKSAPSMPPSGQHMHPSYPPYGFMPPYPSYPMDPLMVDPSLRPSNKTPPDGSVLSPRGQMHPSRPPMDGLSPGRNSSKPSPLIQDENKPLPVDATKAVPKDLSKAPLDLGMPKSSPAPQPATPTVNPALHPAHQANKSVVDLTVSKDSKDPMDGKVKGPIPGTGPMPDPKGAPGQYDPALLAYQRQQEELRRYYNVYPPEGEGPMASMYPPVPLNSPGGAPAWPGLLSGAKGSPLPERNKPPQPPQQNPQSTPNSQPPSHQQTGKTMMANSSASSPKLRPPSVESRSKEHDLHRHADQRREKEREKERESSLERNKAASEGVKPTMETHGPPPPPGPPPGSMPGGLAFSYLYPYGLPFDPSHPAYRSMASMMGGPHFGPPGPGHSHPFLGPGHPHLGPQQPPQMPPGMRYPFQGGPPSEAQMLEMLHGQYWSQGGMPPQGAQGPPQQGPPPPNHQPQPQQQNPSQQAAGSHKIHELTERAMKSPPVSPAVGPGGLPSSSQSGGTSSTPSGPKHNDRRSPSGGMGPGMGHRPPGHGGPMPGASPGGPPGHQLPGFLTPLSSQYPPSSVYGGKPLLRP